MTEYFSCPACKTKSTLKHHVVHADKEQLYFQCRNNDCRNHFQVLRMSGQVDRIVAQSPHKVTQPVLKAENFHNKVAAMGCPKCGNYGKVKMTDRREDGYWRRHMCLTCGPYFTCETNEGVTVHRKKRSRLAREVA